MAPNGPPTRGSVDELAAQVRGLRNAYENYRRLVRYLIVIGVVLCFVVVWLWVVAGDAESAADGATSAAKEAKNAVAQIDKSQEIICQNNNDSRASTRKLWNYILSQSAQSADPDRKAATEEVLAWINILYGERDCSQPNKKYVIPDPPDLSKYNLNKEQTNGRG